MEHLLGHQILALQASRHRLGPLERGRGGDRIQRAVALEAAQDRVQSPWQLRQRLADLLGMVRRQQRQEAARSANVRTSAVWSCTPTARVYAIPFASARCFASMSRSYSTSV